MRPTDSVSIVPCPPAYQNSFAELVSSVHRQLGADVSPSAVLAVNGFGDPAADGDMSGHALTSYVPAHEQSAMGLCVTGLRKGVLSVASDAEIAEADIADIVERLGRAHLSVSRVETVVWPHQRMVRFRRDHTHVAIERLPLMLSRISVAADDGHAVETAIADIFDVALERRASDIHLEQHATDLSRSVVMLRIDGDMVPLLCVPPLVMAPIVARIKTMAGVDPSEARKTQDGRFTTWWRGRRIDVRLGYMPGESGGGIALRLLDKETLVPLGRLFEGAPDVLHRLRSIFAKPVAKESGLVLLSGPTGSGKTTTMYGAIMDVDRIKRVVWSVEAPVEYDMPRVGQISITDKGGMTVADAVRGFVRMDVDYVVVGEIRDAETVRAMLQLIESSHTVMTTIHASDCVHALSRLTGFLRADETAWGADLIGHGLHAVINQRLVKAVCKTCGRMLRACDVPGLEAASCGRIKADHPVRIADGMLGGAPCPRCLGSGFLGRRLVVEALMPPPGTEVRHVVSDMIRERRLREIGRLDGVYYRPFHDDWIRLVMDGIADPRDFVRQCATG